MKCLTFIRGLDFLSHEVKLTIDKSETRYKSVFGGIMSILALLAMFGFCLFFFIKLIQKESIFVTISSESSHTSNISDSNNYPFLIRLTDKQNKPFSNPEQIYKIALKYWYGGSSTLENVGQKTIDLTIETCDLDKHFGQFRSLFEDITDLHTFHCPVLRPQNESIYGIYGDIYPFGYYHFYVTMCTNNTNCLDIKQIKKITENVYMDFRTVDFSINNLKPEPKVETVRTDRHMLSSTVYKRIWVYLDSIKYVTDTGLFFSTESTEYFSQLDSMRYDIDLRDIFTGTIPGTFVTMTVLNTGKTIVYNRKYLKLQDYLANVGGIAKVIQIVALVLNYTYSQNSYSVMLINELQSVDAISHKNSRSNQQARNNSNPLINNLISSSVEPKLDVTDSKEFVDAKKAKRRNLLDDRVYKWYYRLFPIQVLPKKERELLSKCIDLLNSKLNIVAILTKLEESYNFLKNYANESQSRQNTLFQRKKKVAYNLPLDKLGKTRTMNTSDQAGKHPSEKGE